jgi:putative tricarboxylic transport membrane protein
LVKGEDKYNVASTDPGEFWILRFDLSRACLAAFALFLGTGLAAAEPLYSQLRLIAPAAPGGGWDQTARAMQQVLQSAGIVTTPVVENIPGAAGTIGLARFVGAERGNGDALLVSGLIMLGGIVTHRSPITLEDAVPLARLTGEYEVLAVPAASPFQTLADLLTAFKAHPESISWGGGSAGGSDQILAGLIADAVGVAPRRVNYIAFSGGGESLAAILGGQVSVGINGLAEFTPQIDAGAVRVLAISSAERLPGVAAPTLREQGVNVEFENWRSILAPPGISASDRDQLEAAVGAMVRSKEWQEMLERYRWLDRYLPGEAFARFSVAEEQRVRNILRELGTGEAAAESQRIGAYPLFVLTGLILFGLGALVSVAAERARRAPASGGGNWRPLVLIGAGVLLNLALAASAGFIVASAVLFWLVARAFDPRRPWRDACFAVGVAAAAYVLFARVLQVSLPTGVLAGWL